MSSKIRIKVGHIEVEYDGAEHFNKTEFTELLSTILDTYHKNPVAAIAPQAIPTPAAMPAGVSMSTSDIATKLGCKSGPELALAAVAHLIIFKGQKACTQKEILAEMKNATAHFSKSYASNLSVILQNLSKRSELNNPASNTYSLPAAKISELRTRLAQ